MGAEWFTEARVSMGSSVRPTLTPRAPRAYCIHDIFANGTAILDAEDDQAADHRRYVAVADLPGGYALGVHVLYYPNGEISAYAEVHPAPPIDELPGGFVPMIQGLVDMLAINYSLSRQLAAHLIMNWIRIEYTL
jgi:hypothetical protein